MIDDHSNMPANDSIANATTTSNPSQLPRPLNLIEYTQLESCFMSGLDPQMPNQFTSDPKSFQIRNYSSLAALVFLLLEYLSNCHAEYNYVWRAPTTVIKYIYLISRYAGLLALMVHYCFIHLFLIDAPVKLEQCRIWYIFLFGTCGTVMATLDATLLLRVYALYEKDVRVHILALPVVLQFVVASILMEGASRSYLFNSHCDKESSSNKMIGFMGGSVILAHTALWVTTFAKRNIAQGQAVVVRLVVREGGWTVLLLVGIVVTAVTFAVASDSANPFAIFVWPTVLMSVMTCRIILNMNMLKTESPASTDFRLSTIIDIV